jgi:hypothetical protein
MSVALITCTTLSDFAEMHLQERTRSWFMELRGRVEEECLSASFKMKEKTRTYKQSARHNQVSGIRG